MNKKRLIRNLFLRKKATAILKDFENATRDDINIYSEDYGLYEEIINELDKLNEMFNGKDNVDKNSSPETTIAQTNVKHKVLQIKHQNTTIIGLLIEKKLQKFYWSCFMLILSFIGSWIASRFFSLPYLNLEILILVLIVALLINQKTLEYRVKNGYYGTNEYEAREIIRFIIDHSKDFDNFNGLKIFPDPKSYESLKELGVAEGADLYD